MREDLGRQNCGGEEQGRNNIKADIKNTVCEAVN